MNYENRETDFAGQVFRNQNFYSHRTGSHRNIITTCYEFFDCNFNGVKFVNCNFDLVDFFNCSFIGAVFENCVITLGLFKKCDFTDADISDSSFSASWTGTVFDKTKVCFDPWNNPMGSERLCETTKRVVL